MLSLDCTKLHIWNENHECRFVFKTLTIKYGFTLALWFCISACQVRKWDVSKETSEKTHWWICNNPCRSSSVFYCKCLVGVSFRPGFWSKSTNSSCLVRVSKHELYPGLSKFIELLNEAKRMHPPIGNCAKLLSCIGGAGKTEGFQENNSFIYMGQKLGRGVGFLGSRGKSALTGPCLTKRMKEGRVPQNKRKPHWILQWNYCWNTEKPGLREATN